MTYLKLFFVFFKVGLFSFGGGYAILPLMQHEVVDVNKWKVSMNSWRLLLFLRSLQDLYQ